MSGRSLIVLGTGGHAAVVVDLALAAGYSVTGCLGPEQPVLADDRCSYLGGDELLHDMNRDEVSVTIGIGSVGAASLRRKLFENAKELGFQLMPLTHPRAVVADGAMVGEGSQVMAGAIVQAHAKLGRNVIVNTGAVVEHHVEIGDHAHIAPAAVLCGGAKVGSGSHIGANATVLQGVTIGEGCVVAAGACVIRDVAHGNRVKGIPAK
ncbi:MAG: acetyltransferase [Hyphomicrobium sp.]